jgi:tetratricopeptide (TPR) repeat protein
MITKARSHLVIFLLSSFILANTAKTYAHNDQHAEVIAPSSLAEIKKLYDTTLASKDFSQLNLQVAHVDFLFVVPVNELRKDVGLAPGFGEEYISYIPLDGRQALNADEQMSFDLSNQGLAMFHNFHYIDAVRSFEQALRINPNLPETKAFLALAYLSFSGDISGYLYAVQQLAELKQMSLNAKQSAWLNFTEAYVFSGPGTFPLQGAFTSLLRITQNDIEAITLGGWLSQYGSIDSYKKALVLDPNHVGASHYLTHLYESRNDFKTALSYGEMHAKLAPQGGHAQHMFGHILPMIGDLDLALVQFLKADKIHKDWAAKYNYDIHYDWHTSHNFHLLGVTYLAKKQYNEAADTLKEGCVADFRACEALAKVAVMQLDSLLLDETITLALGLFSPSESAGVRDYFKRFQLEIDYVSGKITNTTALASAATAYRDSVGQAIARLASVTPGSSAYKQMITLVDSLFLGGGFDSWANGYPNAMRLRNAATELKLNDLVNYIDQKVNSIIGTP